MSLNEEQTRKIRLKNDLEFYAPRCLMIRTKQGTIEPFHLNTAQKHLHEIAQRQIEDRGYVRIIGLKGRQQGFSTYVQGRAYHKVSWHRGKKAYILTHEAEATKNLFEMAERFHNNCPDGYRPDTNASNAKELSFGGLDSGYRVATAGTKDTGRSATFQYFHGSEVAFWPNADVHAKGAMQAVPSGREAMGTEVWLESTANGRNNYFYHEWRKAEQGESEYEAVFIPWFWQDEYRSDWDSKWSLEPEESRIRDAHNLDYEQLAWRRLKIRELSVMGQRGFEAFKQEYPCTPEEAFDIMAGAAMEKLSRERHILRQFTIPNYWTRFTSIDWGTAKPFSLGWYTVTGEPLELRGQGMYPTRHIPEGSIIRYREWYGWSGEPDKGCRMEAPDVAERILEVEEENGELIDYRIGDTDMWAQHDGPSPQERMWERTEGMFMMGQAKKDRQANYENFRIMIQGTDGIPEFDTTENCRHFWRTVPELQLDEIEPNKGPGKKFEGAEQEDHVYKEVVYALASRAQVTTETERVHAEFKEAKRRSKVDSTRVNPGGGY